MQTEWRLCPSGGASVESSEREKKRKERNKMCENKRLPSLDVWSIESCSWCQNASDSDKECGGGGGDGGGWEGPLSAAPIRRITVTRPDVSLAANNTGAEDDVSLCLSSAVRLRASLWQLLLADS